MESEITAHIPYGYNDYSKLKAYQGIVFMRFFVVIEFHKSNNVKQVLLMRINMFQQIRITSIPFITKPVILIQTPE